jgi:predicted kinase
LIVFSGLPGTGKTALAEAIGRSLGVPVFAVAWILGALAPLGVLERSNRAPVAYALLTMLASRQLMLGQSAVLDGMAGARSVREGWHTLARQHGAEFVVIECICSDEALHRRRIEARSEYIPGWPDPGWDHVSEMRSRYEPWSGDRLVVDSVDSYARNLSAVEEYIAAAGRR